MIRTALLLVLLSGSIYTCAQSTDSRFRSLGATVGTGIDFNVSGKYTVYYLAGDLSWQFNKKPAHRFLAFYVEPQVNGVDRSGTSEIEFGTNIGLRYYYAFSRTALAYLMLGSGPHYISADVDRQANGFIFSDNLGIGLFKGLKGSTFLNFQLFVRHLSNAGFKLPNGGINTFNVRLGLSKIRFGLP